MWKYTGFHLYLTGIKKLDGKVWIPNLVHCPSKWTNQIVVFNTTLHLKSEIRN